MGKIFDPLGFKKNNKIWYNEVGSNRKPAMFIQYDGSTAIIKEVGKINSQGYSIARPFGIHVSLISPRKEKLSELKK